jgi:signal transduction histidine kinase
MDLYDRAIAAAVQQGFVNIEAVAAERAAKFWYAANKTDFGDIYLDRALQAYQLWGALGKAADLRRAYRAETPEPVAGTSGSNVSTRGFENINALDLATVLKSSQAIAGEIRLDRLLATMIEIILANAGGEFAALILKSGDDFLIQGLKTPEIDDPQVMLARPLNRSSDVSRGIVNYVIRTREVAVLEEPAKHSRFRNDRYVKTHKPKSVLCAPIIRKGELNGVIYLENNQVSGAFTPERLEALNVLLAQIAVSIENATLYAQQERQTREIEDANVALTKEIGERRRAEQELNRYKDRLEELVAKRTEELERAQGRLVDMSRRAGMAEVASGVLHNVGNVMNSLNVGVSVTREAVRSLRVEGLPRVCDLLEQHAGELGEFIASDEAGKKIPRYLRMLGEELSRDKQATIGKIDEVLEHLEHMKEIIAAQQSYARTAGVTELCTLDGIVETALTISQIPANVEVTRDLEEMPPIRVDRHQVLQILVNLLSNARHAVRESGSAHPRIQIRSSRDASGIKLEVHDNGVGITRENLSKVFNHGFTTKRHGHGFGLHNSANAAQHLEGSLTAASDGHGEGARFTLRLPVELADDDPMHRGAALA